MTTANQLAGYASSLPNFRNKIINGNFDIWQREISNPYTANQFGSDRWLVRKNDTVNFSIDRQSFIVGQTAIPNNPRYYLNLTLNSSGSGSDYIFLCQRIEDVRTLSGKTVTLSFWAKTDTAHTFTGGTIAPLEITQHFGTGGLPNVNVRTVIQNSISLTTTWQKLSYTFTVPSISGKTIGTNNNDYLEIGFLGMEDQDVGRTISISQVQLEEGTVATPFEHRPIGLELSLCQRYYTEATPNLAFAFSATQVTSQCVFNEMRASPSASTKSGNGAIDPITGAGISPSSISNSYYIYDNKSVLIISGNFSGLTTYKAYWYRPDDIIVALSSEL